MIGRRRPILEDAAVTGVTPAKRLLVNLFMVAVLAYFMLPLVWVLIASTKSNGDLFTTFGLWFGKTFELFDNIGDLFSKDGGIFSRWLLNTAYYAGFSALGAAVTSAMAGYALSKYRFRGRGLILAITLGAIIVPPQTLVLPTFLMLSKIDLAGSTWSVILPMMVNPIGVFLMKVYADSAVPDELIEAARVDGAGDLRIFWTIAFRLLLPGVITVFLLTFVANWNNFFLPLVMLTNDHLYPVTVGLANWNKLAAAGLEVSYSTVVTGALISIIPVMAVFVIMQRYWQSGLTAGGVK